MGGDFLSDYEINIMLGGVSGTSGVLTNNNEVAIDYMLGQPKGISWKSKRQEMPRSSGTILIWSNKKPHLAEVHFSLNGIVVECSTTPESEDFEYWAELSSPEEKFDEMEYAEVQETKLDLAEAYLEMGDVSGPISLCREVISDGIKKFEIRAFQILRNTRFHPGFISYLVEECDRLGRGFLDLNICKKNVEDESFIMIRELLSERLESNVKIDWLRDREKVLGLYHGDPETFTKDDFEVIVRAIWKSDQVGLYWGGNEVFRNGLLSKIIQAWDNPK